MWYVNGTWSLPSPAGPSSTWLLKSRPISTVCTVVCKIVADRFTVVDCPAARPPTFCATSWLPGWKLTPTANGPASELPLFLMTTASTKGWLGCGIGGLRVALTRRISGLGWGDGVNVAGVVGEGIGVGGATTTGSVLMSPNTSTDVAIIQPFACRKSITYHLKSALAPIN